MKFRKKPVVIDAIQWDGINLSEVKAFCPIMVVEIYDAAWRVGVGNPVAHLTIPTLEGDMAVSYGDFIIKGVQGEFYPCKPNIFMETYAPADAAEAIETLSTENARLTAELAESKEANKGKDDEK
jgi:hypothetical protein